MRVSSLRRTVLLVAVPILAVAGVEPVVFLLPVIATAVMAVTTIRDPLPPGGGGLTRAARREAGGVGAPRYEEARA